MLDKCVIDLLYLFWMKNLSKKDGKMKSKELKQKSFSLVEKMEKDGWELLLLDRYVTTLKNRPDRIDGWFAVFIKDGIHIYIEIEDEERTWLRDVPLYCPECGELQDHSEWGGELCMKCEVPYTYRKNINQEYVEYKYPLAG